MLKVEPSSATRLHDGQRVRWQSRDGDVTVAAQGVACGLEDAERQAAGHRPDLAGHSRVQLGKAVGDQLSGAGLVERRQLHDGADTTRDQALSDFAQRRASLGSRPECHHDRLTDRAAGQVVEQPQRRLVGLVDVIDQQQEPVPGRREPEQLGRGDEQALVGGLAAPGDLAAGQGAPQLVAVRVVQPVQQRRVSAAEVRERLEHRGVRPGALDGRGAATGDPPAAPGGVGGHQVEHRASCPRRRLP